MLWQIWLSFWLFLLFYFQLIYKAHSKEEMAKVTTTADSVDIQRAKWAQQLTNKASSDMASRIECVDLHIFFPW